MAHFATNTQEVELKSLLLFYILSIAAAGLNYLFQAVVAKLLGQVQYAQFMSEWSLVSTLMFFGSMASFWAALGNSQAKKIISLAGSSFVLSAIMLGLFHILELNWLLATSLVLASVAQSFILGKWLGGGRRFAFCILGLVTSVIKLILIFIFTNPDTNDFFQAMVASYFIATALVFFLTSNPLEDYSNQKNSKGWLAAIYLAGGTHFLPNADVLWFRYFSTTEQLEFFSPLTLVTRAIFFFQIIFAQWWLSESVEKIKLNHRNFYMLLVLSIMFSAAIAVVIRLSILQFLGWSIVPGIEFFLLAGIYAAATGLFFQFLQLNVVNSIITKSTIMLIMMFVPWLLCGVLQVMPLNFLLTSASLYILVMLIVHHVDWSQRNIL